MQRLQRAVAERAAARQQGGGGGDGGGGGGGAPPAGLELKDPLVLTQRGERDGQICVVREGGGGVAYTWSAARCAGWGPLHS